MGTTRFEKREIDDVPIDDDDDTDGAASRWGFLMPEPVDGEFLFQGRDEDYPDPWLEEGRSGELPFEGNISQDAGRTCCRFAGWFDRPRWSSCLVYAGTI